MSHARFDELPEPERQLLRARARELARHVESGPTEPPLELLEVRAHDQRIALPLEAVEGVVPLGSVASLARVPRFVAGLVGFRGEVLIAVELGVLLGHSGTGFADFSRAVALSVGGKRLALITERSLGVVQAPLASFRADAMKRQDFVLGTDGEFLTLVDPGRLIAHVFSALSGAAR